MDQVLSCKFKQGRETKKAAEAASFEFWYLIRTGFRFLLQEQELLQEREPVQEPQPFSL